MRIRVFIGNDDVLALQNCCDMDGRCTLTIGGPPTPIDACISLEQVTCGARWSVVYLNCDKLAYALAVETAFRRAIGEFQCAEALAK